jgi:hypothetical protein
MIEDGDMNTHDLALGFWMAVRRMSRSRISPLEWGEGATSGICSSGTIISCGIKHCTDGDWRVKGGINGVFVISSHGSDRDEVGESNVVVDMPLDDEVGGVPADAAPIAPPGWKPRKTSEGLFPVAV